MDCSIADLSEALQAWERHCAAEKDNFIANWIKTRQPKLNCFRCGKLLEDPKWDKLFCNETCKFYYDYFKSRQ